MQQLASAVTAQGPIQIANPLPALGPATESNDEASNPPPLGLAFGLGAVNALTTAVALEGHGRAASPALRISDRGSSHFVHQSSIGTNVMAEPIDSAL